jgi:hypothetical protein
VLIGRFHGGDWCLLSNFTHELRFIYQIKSNFRSMSPKSDPLPVVTSDGPIHRSLSLDSRAERTPATAFCQPHGSIEICLPFRVTHRDLQIRPYIHGSNLGAVPLVRYRVHLNLIHFSTDIFFGEVPAGHLTFPRRPEQVRLLGPPCTNPVAVVLKLPVQASFPPPDQLTSRGTA